MPPRSTSIRLPADLDRRVRAEADRNMRSVQAEAVDLIERALAGAAERLADPKTRASAKKSAGECPHPRGRVIKGFCYRCGKPVSV